MSKTMACAEGKHWKCGGTVRLGNKGSAPCDCYHHRPKPETEKK